MQHLSSAAKSQDQILTITGGDGCGETEIHVGRTGRIPWRRGIMLFFLRAVVHKLCRGRYNSCAAVPADHSTDKITRPCGRDGKTRLEEHW